LRFLVVNSSDHLVIMDMIAPNGRKDVYFMAKDIRSYLSDLYPDCGLVFLVAGIVLVDMRGFANAV